MFPSWFQLVKVDPRFRSRQMEMEMRNCYFEGNPEATIDMTRNILSRSKCMKESVDKDDDDFTCKDLQGRLLSS